MRRSAAPPPRAALAALPAAAAAWRPAPSPLMTRWGAAVTPEQSPAYPRPEMARGDGSWGHLNGLWEVNYSIADLSDPPVGRPLSGEILVPYPIESPLSGIRNLTENSHMFYRRVFPAGFFNCSMSTLLHFEAVDWNATVWLDGALLGSHAGGYDPFSFDISAALKAGGGAHEVIVGVFDPTDAGEQPVGKQSLAAFQDKARGNHYVPTSGIWQTVWFECVPPAHFTNVVPVPNVVLDGRAAEGGSSSAVTFEIELAGAAAGSKITVDVIAPGGSSPLRSATCTVSAAENCSSVTVPIAAAGLHLWAPGSPRLYTYAARAASGGAEDAVRGHFAMRRVEVALDAGGTPRPMLNGRFVYMMATLDQGFWPDGAHAAPSDEALRYDLQVLQSLGYNTVRKHIKVEPRRWYYYCDVMGIMVWQDFVSPDKFKKPSAHTQELQLDEGRALIRSRRQFGCIVQWVTFNEGWGQADQAETEEAVAIVRGMDKTRLVNGCTGCKSYGAGDVSDKHHYAPPACPSFNPAPGHMQYAANGEYGGVELAVTGHEWIPGGCHGYAQAADAAALTTTYENYAEQIVGFISKSGLSSSVYTQTTDCERECNGVMTYDRVVKPIVPRWAAANGRIINATAQL